LGHARGDHRRRRQYRRRAPLNPVTLFDKFAQFFGIRRCRRSAEHGRYGGEPRVLVKNRPVRQAQAARAALMARLNIPRNLSRFYRSKVF